jgi:hypothetical protein
MPCYQSTNLPPGVTTTGRTSYTTEADCNQACKEGACCEGTTCSVKPQCQCQGAGKVFKGVGTVCTPNPCTCVPGGCADFTVTANNTSRVISIAGNPSFSTKNVYQLGTTSCGGIAYAGAWCDQGIISPLFPSCENGSVARRRVYVDVFVSFGCFVDPFSNDNCSGRFVKSFVFDRFDPFSGVPLGPPCSLGGVRLESFGQCASCKQYQDCFAEGMNASVMPSCNPLP